MTSNYYLGKSYQNTTLESIPLSGPRQQSLASSVKPSPSISISCDQWILWKKSFASKNPTKKQIELFILKTPSSKFKTEKSEKVIFLSWPVLVQSKAKNNSPALRKLFKPPVRLSFAAAPSNPEHLPMLFKVSVLPV